MAGCKRFVPVKPRKILELQVFHYENQAMKINPIALGQLEADVSAEMVPIILRQFGRELKDRGEALKVAAAAADLDQIALHAHSLKSTARTVGLDEIADCASQCEKAALAGISADALDYASALISMIPEGMDCLTTLDAPRND